MPNTEGRRHPKWLAPYILRLYFFNTSSIVISF